jgi:glucokinase
MVMPRVDSTLAPGAPVLALDLGGTHLRTAVVEADGRVRARRHNRTPRDHGADRLLTAATESLRASRDEHLAAGGVAPAAVGISAPGPLNPQTGITIDPPNMGRSFVGLSLGPMVGDAVGLPWALERDTNVAVLAEAAFGAGRGHRDLVYLTVSTGVGGGVISDGRLLTGPDGVAGELGHLTVDVNGPVCGCGGLGHLERLSSGTGIAQSAQDALAAGEDAPELARIAERISPAPLEAIHVSEAAEAGDPVAAGILERARRAFAVAVVSIVDVFNPDRVIVGGGIAMAWGDRLLDPAREAVEATAFRVQAARARIVPAELGDDTGLIGTVRLVALARDLGSSDGHAQTSKPAVARAIARATR